MLWAKRAAELEWANDQGATQPEFAKARAEKFFILASLERLRKESEGQIPRTNKMWTLIGTAEAVP